MPRRAASAYRNVLYLSSFAALFNSPSRFPLIFATEACISSLRKPNGLSHGIFECLIVEASSQPQNHLCVLADRYTELQAEGFLQLPEVRNLGGRGPRRVDVSVACSEPAPIAYAASQCEPLELVLVEGRADGRRWREQMQRYHYLGCRVPFGANLRYWVRHEKRELACLLWTSPAWKMQARDTWIGWNDEQRRNNLQLTVNNGRFLILPWVQVKGLASKILGLSARQMPSDWEMRHGRRPLLLETLVDGARFRGTCYRAANWIHIGQTSGRGRMDRTHTAHGQAIKDIYVYPLARDARQRLCGSKIEGFSYAG